MFCKNCGAPLTEGSIFCPMCGTNNAPDAGAAQDNAPAAQQPQENTEANTASDNNAAESQTAAGNNAQPVNNR